MRTRVLSAAIALVMGLVPLVGCDSDNDSELQRVVCEVELVNDGAPLVSAYVEDGGDGIIGADPTSGTNDDDLSFDQVAVSFRARPFSTSTTTIIEDGAYSSFIITGYNLIWHAGAAAPLDLSPYNVTNGPFYLKVPINEDAVAAVMVVDRAMKGAILAAMGGSYPNNLWPETLDFTAIAELQFIGHDSGSQHETTIYSGLSVTFTAALAAS